MGEAGVPIFFVISGFVIAHSLAKDQINSTYIAKFALRRSIRLDPPYWGSIVLVLCMAWLSALVKGEGFEWPSITTLLAHLFYLQGILDIPHLNIIYWTLCLEIQFYLVFCILNYLIQLFKKNQNIAFIIVFSLASITSLLWPTKIIEQNVHPGLFLPHWHAFLIGVFAYWSWKRRIPTFSFYIYFLILFSATIIHSSPFSMAASLTAIIIHECARYNAITSTNWRWTQFLGVISYSLYLTHNPITGASYFLIYKIFGNSTIMQSVALAVSSAICIFFAYIFWWIFERWSIEFSKKISTHSQHKCTGQ